jgi:hypothetical protein
LRALLVSLKSIGQDDVVSLGAAPLSEDRLAPALSGTGLRKKCLSAGCFNSRAAAKACLAPDDAIVSWLPLYRYGPDHGFICRS